MGSVVSFPKHSRHESQQDDRSEAIRNLIKLNGTFLAMAKHIGTEYMKNNAFLIILIE